MANFQKWTYQINARAKVNRAPSRTGAMILDRLTVTGGGGMAYLLPVYEIEGSFL